MNNAIVSRVEEIAGRVGGSEGIEIVEVELKGGGRNRLLRIAIDKEGGVTHGDCEFISHQVGTILDVEEVIPGGTYTLEVTSPGVERKLVKIKDFEKFQGQKVRIVLREPVENAKRWEGTLAGVSEGVITLDAGADRKVQFRFDQVEKANLKFEWGTRA